MTRLKHQVWNRYIWSPVKGAWIFEGPRVYPVGVLKIVDEKLSPDNVEVVHRDDRLIIINLNGHKHLIYIHEDWDENKGF